MFLQPSIYLFEKMQYFEWGNVSMYEAQGHASITLHKLVLFHVQLKQLRVVSFFFLFAFIVLEED